MSGLSRIRGEDNLKEYLESVKRFSDVSNYCYLVYMAIRILEMRRVMKDTGSLYYHCDHTMSHYIKIMLDMIFRNGFKNEIIWKRMAGSKGNTKDKFPVATDSIFLYSKGKQPYFANQYTPLSQDYIDNFYKHTDEKGRRYRGPGGNRPKHYRYYLDESKGTPVTSLWVDIKNVQGGSKERTGYPTQKPTALLERIINASSKMGEVVLDPFCGCATTCIAAEKLDRNWIGIDISKKAHDLVCERLEAEVWPHGTRDWTKGEPNFETEPPTRTSKIVHIKGWVYVADSGIYEPNQFKVWHLPE